MTPLKDIAKALRLNGAQLTVTDLKLFEYPLFEVTSDKYYIRPISGGSRYSGYNDATARCEKVISALNLQVTIGNDAPRRGKTGFYIQIDIPQLRAAIKEKTDYDIQEEIIQKKKQSELNAARIEKDKSDIITEANSIIVDQQFKDALTWASESTGMEKNNRHASAMKALIERNGKEKIETDFWQVFRLLKKRSETSNA